MSAVAWPTIMAAIQAWVRGATGLDDSHVLWSLYGAPRPEAPWVELNIQESRSPAHDWTTVELNVFTFADQTVSSVDTGGDRLEVLAHPFTTGDGPVRVTATVPPGGLSLGRDYWVVAPDASHVQLCDEFAKTGGNYPGNPITPVDLTSAGTGPIKIVQQPTTTRAGRGYVKTAQGLREVHLEIQVFGALKSGITAFSIAEDIRTSLGLYNTALDDAGVGVSDLGTAFVQGSVRSTPGNRGELLEPRAIFDMTIYVAASLSSFSDFIQTVQAAIKLTAPDGASFPEQDITIRS